MRVPPGASRQCKIVQRILLNLREQRRDGIAVVEPGKLDRAEDVGLKVGARQPRGSARFSCEGGFAEKSPAPVTLDRRAEMVIVALRHSRPADIERRSEEHTSELQSLMRISYAVFCLKTNIIHKHQQD